MRRSQESSVVFMYVVVESARVIKQSSLQRKEGREGVILSQRHCLIQVLLFNRILGDHGYSALQELLYVLLDTDAN